MVGFITSCALSKFPHNIFSGGVISNAVAKPQTRKRVFVFFSSIAPCTVCTLLGAQSVMLSSCCAHCTGCWRCNKLVLLSKCARHTSTLHQDLSAEEKRFVRKLLPDLRVDEIVLKKCLWPLRAQAGPQVHLHCNKFHRQGTEVSYPWPEISLFWISGRITSLAEQRVWIVLSLVRIFCSASIKCQPSSLFECTASSLATSSSFHKSALFTDVVAETWLTYSTTMHAERGGPRTFPYIQCILYRHQMIYMYKLYNKYSI